MKWKEYYNKISIYLNAGQARWPVADTDPRKEEELGVLGPYQLVTAARLEDGHFLDFDRDGLPVRITKRYAYKPVHLYSTLCCFAFAHWDRYLLTGNLEDAQSLMKVADYMLTTAEHLPEGAVLLRGPGEGGSEHGGPCDALDLGQAMSVLCRAYQFSGDIKYLKLANGCMLSFQNDIASQGVRSYSHALGTLWFDEIVTPPARHVLNGMICALWGLRDYAIVGKSAMAWDMYRIGVESVAKAMPRFDTGNWSLYWVADGICADYVATMNYHLLHICQLNELWKQTSNDIFKVYADRFLNYANRPALRFRALIVNIKSRMH